MSYVPTPHSSPGAKNLRSNSTRLISIVFITIILVKVVQSNSAWINNSLQREIGGIAPGSWIIQLVLLLAIAACFFIEPLRNHNNIKFNQGDILPAFFMIFCWSVLSGGIASLLPGAEDSFVMNAHVLRTPAGILMGAVLAPVLEEIIFRGVLLKNLLYKITPATSILLTSILFAISHNGHIHIIAVFLGGLAFSYIYYSTGSLHLCIILHAINNILAIFLSAPTSNHLILAESPHLKVAGLIIAIFMSYGAYKIWTSKEHRNKPIRVTSMARTHE